MIVFELQDANIITAMYWAFSLGMAVTLGVGWGAIIMTFLTGKMSKRSQDKQPEKTSENPARDD